MLRPATDADLEQMLTWRNQQANREASNNQHVISLDEHRAWWARASQDPTRRDLVFEHDGRALGVVNFFDLDGEERTGSWGFYLDHETTTAEGTAMLVWQAVMKEAIAHAFDELGLDVLHAEVLEHNEAVRMTNRRFRFTEGEPFERTVGEETIRVIPIELRRENRRGQKK